MGGVRSDSESSESFEDIVHRYTPYVRRLMYRMAIGEEIAEELTQEVFLKVYRSLPAFRREAKLTTWLYRIAVNTVRSHLRRQGRVSRMEIPSGGREDLPAPDGFDPRTSEADADRAVTEALRSLPVPLRTAVVLTAIEGKDYGEAASIEGCTKATLYWRIHRARKLLKERLKELL